jgi:hypothetical protein
MLASLTLILFAVPAEAVFFDREKRGNLDGDPAIERAFTVEVGNDRTALKIADPCPSGEAYSRRVTGVEDSLARLKLHSADTRPGKEVFVDLRSGAAGRAGEARVIAWRHPEGEVCGVPRRLFYFDSEVRHRPPPVKGAYLANFGVRVKDASASHPGKEVVVDEFWARSTDGACCPTIARRVWYRYASGRDRYVVYDFKTYLRTPED